MSALAFVLPLLPGKTDTDRAAMTSCWRGERQAAHQQARRRLGITREATFIQHTPTGDVAVVYLEADDVEAALKGMATSQEPFDRWYRDHVREVVHGRQRRDGFPPQGGESRARARQPYLATTGTAERLEYAARCSFSRLRRDTSR